MAVIELEVLSGRGGWEGSKGNLTGYSYKEAATPLAAGDASGATPSFTVGVSEDDTINGTFALLESKIQLTDDATGQATGIVRTIASVDGAAGLEVESILSKLNAEISVGPYSGTLSGAIGFYMDVVGISGTDYTVDPTIATMPVTLPGWYGSVWENLKFLCVALRVEIAGVSGRIAFRPIRRVVGNEERNMSTTFNVDNTTIARAVEVYYYNNTYMPVGRMYPTGSVISNLPDTAAQVPAQSFQVGAGEVVVASVAINAYIMDINQPVAAAEVSDVLGSASVYTVIDKDGKIVDPGLWTGTGGSITAAAGEAPDELVITVTGAALSNRAPFRIAMPVDPLDPDNQDTFPSLSISGEGVFFKKQLFTIPTGADPSLAVAPVGVTIDNPFISTIGQAASAGVLAAKNYSGRNKTIQVSATSVADIGINGSIVFYSYDSFQNDQLGNTYATFQTAQAGNSYAAFSYTARQKSADAKLVQAFGNVPGARIPYRDSYYRIREVTYTEEGLQYTAESDTIATDFESKMAGVTYGQYGTSMVGRSYNDYAIAPLYRAPILDTLITNSAVHPTPTVATLGNGTEPWSVPQAGVTASLVTTAFGNRSAMRAVRTSSTAAFAMRMDFNQIPAQPSKQVTYQFKARATGQYIGAPVTVQLRQGTTTANLNSANAGTYSADWQTYTLTRTVPSTNVNNLSVQLTFGTGVVNSDYVDVADFVFVVGGYVGEYVDGDTPGWTWDGAAYNSTSTGFPYTLKSILPADPYLEVVGAGTVTRADKLNNTDDRTIFTVFDFIGQSLFAKVASFGNTANGNHNSAIYGHNTTTGVFGRVQTGTVTSGVDYRDITVAGPRTLGRHIGILTTSGSMTTETVTVTSTSTGLALSAAVAIPVGAQHQANSLASVASVDHTPLYQVVYAGTIDSATRINVMRWLANKYGVRYTP